jgi:tRNA A-37 threonylcarbamoyl transferase component Bud32/tetratricopeptide (TPR) repeat protein
VASIVERLRAAVADRYDVQDEIGQGGMARVFRAEDRKHGRRVAVKVLRPELAAAVGAERFLREIEISAGLRHPNVLPLFDSGEADGLLYYVMPLVEGESLRSRMERERQLPLEDALEIALEVADALSYAHSRGVVHRDIKPENILLESGHAVVTDFGIARAIEGGGRGGPITEAGLAIGTPAYMSPEQASGDAVVDGRTDLYALGCVLYEMLAGEPPHTGPTPQAILARSLTTDVRPLPPVRASVTPALESVVRRALAPVAADRYHTCHEFAEAVRAARAGTLVPTAAPSLGRVGVAQLARRMLGPILGVLALGAVALVAYRLLGPTTALASGRLGIAVFPFRDTGEGAGWWAEALGDLLATTLDGTPGVSVADPWSLWQSLREGGADRAVAPDADEATRLAGRAGARRFVLGSGFRTGDQLDVTLRIYELGSPTPVHTVTATGSLSALPTLVQELAVAVIAAVWQHERLPDVRDVSGYTTRSADALNAYLDARGALRAGMVDSAERAIDQAIALDTNFALALVEAVRIKSWALFARGQPYLGLLPLVDRAARFLDSLSERNRSRVEATRALVRTDGVTAMNAARRIVEIDSTDLEGWNLLAYAHQAYGWQYAAGLPELRIAAERARALDPGHLPSLISRAWVAAVGGDSSDVALQITRLEAADTAQPLVAGFLAGLRAATVPDPMFDSLVPRWGTRPSAEWIAALRVLRVSRPARAESLVAAVRAAAPAGPAAAFAQGAQLQLWLAQGRIRRTDSLVQTGGLDAALWLRRAVEFHLVAANLAGVGDSAVASRVVDSLAEWFPPDSAVAQLERRPVWRAGWAIGAHHATFGDTSLTRRWRAALEPMPREGGLSQDWVGALQADFDARLAARRGDLAEALDHARRAYRLWTVHTDNIQEGDPEPAMRLHLGMLHAMGGEVDSAESYLRSLVPPTAWLGFLTARASFELGRLAEQRRSLTEATRYYARALDLWELGGDEVSAWRAQAREGLARVARRAG